MIAEMIIAAALIGLFALAIAGWVRACDLQRKLNRAYQRDLLDFGGQCDNCRLLRMFLAAKDQRLTELEAKLARLQPIPFAVVSGAEDVEVSQ